MTADLSKPNPLTVKEAAAEAGVALATIYRAIERGELDTVKPRRTVAHKIARAEFKRWLQARREPGRQHQAK